jgi:hypothetical protein
MAKENLTQNPFVGNSVLESSIQTKELASPSPNSKSEFKKDARVDETTTASKCGRSKQKWGIRITRSKKPRMVYVYADRIQIQDGDLLLYGHPRDQELATALIRSFARGAWHDVFAASTGEMSEDHDTDEPTTHRKRRNATSIYRGISWEARWRQWRARICINGRVRHIGQYSTELAAAQARDAYVIEHGINTPLNFPDTKATTWRREDGKWKPSSWSPEKISDFTRDVRKRVLRELRNSYGWHNGRLLTDEIFAVMGGEESVVPRTSIYRGVSRFKFTRSWRAQICINGRTQFISRHRSELDAARAYDDFILRNNLSKPLNFPEKKKEAA